jgi:hypothetical protein
MMCPVCGSMILDDEDTCSFCGLSRADAERNQGARSTVNARAIQDVVQVVKTVRQLGDEVAEAGLSAAKSAKRSTKSAAAKVWTATKSMVDEGERQGKVAARRLRERGRLVRRKAEVAGHQARWAAKKMKAKGEAVRRRAVLAGHRVEARARATTRRIRATARRSSDSR